MFAKVVAFRDKGWFDKRTDFRLYDQTCRAYGVRFELIDSIDKLIIDNYVILDECGKTELSDYVHKPSDTYVIGRSGQNLMHDLKPIRSIKITTTNAIPMFGSVVCGILLEDRKRKLG